MDHKQAALDLIERAVVPSNAACMGAIIFREVLNELKDPKQVAKIFFKVSARIECLKDQSPDPKRAQVILDDSQVVGIKLTDMLMSEYEFSREDLKEVYHQTVAEIVSDSIIKDQMT